MSLQEKDEIAMKNLVNDLETKEQNDKRDKLIKNAKSHMYCDFSSHLAFPKIKLIEDLQRAGYHDIADKAINGDYDA